MVGKADRPVATLTVGELRDLLGTFQQDLPVLVSGYEGGLADLEAKHVSVDRVDFNVHAGSSVYGAHAKAGEGWDPPTRTGYALLIERG